MGYLRRVQNVLDAGHPVTGAYDANDATAASQMNALNIDNPSPVDAWVTYLGTNDNRTNEGNDTDATLILGRMNIVATANPYTDVFERAGLWAAGGAGANEQIELDATNNKLVFGSAHDISSLNAKDAVRLLGSGEDDGIHRITAISLQEVTLQNLTYSLTIERAFRVFRVQEAKLITPAQIQSAHALLAFLLSPNLTELDFSTSEISNAFDDMESAGVWKPADSSNLVALSQNTISHGLQQGLGVVETVDITGARAL